MKVDLQKATMEQLPVMQRMGSYYVYDMSEYVGSEPAWRFPETGEYECVEFRPYFEGLKSHPFFVRVNGELAGFAIIDDQGSAPEIDHNMAQFFVHRKFKGLGVGSRAAHECFQRFAGFWEVRVIPQNLGAYCFWKRTIRDFTEGDFEENRCSVPHLDGFMQDSFRFRT